MMLACVHGSYLIIRNTFHVTQVIALLFLFILPWYFFVSSVLNILLFFFYAVREGLTNIKQKNGGIETKIRCLRNIVHRLQILKVQGHLAPHHHLLKKTLRLHLPKLEFYTYSLPRHQLSLIRGIINLPSVAKSWI